MLLVPRQLQRSGMTGSVPYYGGRFTPAQAYAASHPQAFAPASPSPVPGAPTAGVREAAPAKPAASPTPPARPDQLEALRQLLDSGALTPAEYEQLRARVSR